MNPVDILRNRAKELLVQDRDWIDTIGIEFTTDKGWGWGNKEKLGKYLPIQRKIRLYNEFQKFPSSPEIAADAIFPTYYHELIHALQHRECGTVGYLLALGLCRPKLERDARDIEDLMYVINRTSKALK